MSEREQERERERRERDEAKKGGREEVIWSNILERKHLGSHKAREKAPWPRFTGKRPDPICPGAVPTLLVLPIPSWPTLLSPQQITLLSFRRAQL